MTFDLREATRDWNPKDRERLAREVDARTEREIRHWFCTRGRKCDGQPHEDYPYKHARGDQWPPPGQDWLLWLILSGRGSGKTRTGSEWLRKIGVSGQVERMAMVGRRGPDVRQTMVEGESGLIYVCERAGVGYDWQPSKKEFTFTSTGSKIYGFSAEEPDTLRGPQFSCAWLDEPAHFDRLEEVWDNLLFGLRLPGLPGGVKILATSTPVPLKWLDERIEEETSRLIRVSSHANRDNLDPMYFATVIAPYEGTRKGRQEIYGEILRDTPGALWKDDMFQIARVDHRDLDRIVVGIDPAGSQNKRSDETGIVVAGKIGDNYYVLEDATDKYSPNGWANRAIDLYQQYDADAIVAEKNFGGDMVESTIRHALEARDEIARILITHAARSKQVRAEPVVGLYERKQVFHLAGLSNLETEQTRWIPGKGASPNRIDALVWAVTELAKLGSTIGTIASLSRRRIIRRDEAMPGTSQMKRPGAL